MVIGALLVLGGIFIFTQNAQSKIAIPIAWTGIVLTVLSLWYR